MTKYKLKDGPQTIPWEESDKDLVLGVLMFSKLLVENCGNRSLYASSGVGLPSSLFDPSLADTLDTAHQRPIKYDRS